MVKRFINADVFASTGQGFLGYNMFAYCGNNPVSGFDPTGEVNWKGVLAGVGIVCLGAGLIALTVATAGAASPLVAAGITACGTAASTAVIETGVVTVGCAATESTMVVDISMSGAAKIVGCSVVVDFKNSTVESYGHTGFSTDTSLSMTYGVGVVHNYEKCGDYAGDFVGGSGAIKSPDGKSPFAYGMSYCFDPTSPKEKRARAVMTTVGLCFDPCFNKFNATGSATYEYYWPLHQLNF